MSTEISTPSSAPLTTADRSTAVTESLKRFARIARQSDHKKGIRAYQTHIRRDPWIPAFFVLLFLLPTMIAAGYFYLVASDRYITEARFALRPALGNVDKVQSEDTGSNSSLSKQMIAQDTLITTSYIASRQMIETMERQMPLREMFSRDGIDFFSRFDADEPIERFMRYWHKRVTTSVDSNGGIISLKVAAFDAQESYTLTRALLDESERMVNELSLKARNAALAESTRELKNAEERLHTVQRAMRDLRNRAGILDAQSANKNNLMVIAELRKKRIDLSVQLNQSLRDLAPERRPIQDLKAQIQDLDDNIEKIERQMTSTDPDQRRLLSEAMTEFEGLENERKNALLYHNKVLAASEQARIVANRQIEFFTPVVDPVVPTSAIEPRKHLITSIVALVAMVVFGFAVLIRKYFYS
ncbi:MULTISPECIES: capsule biosynthesis protein [Methylorubrum]|uniref:capsule biosynthesis protein n=1 Tax=Methylorubrum TaxID=2282523 RepID=UPI00209D16A9|nr:MULTISPECIES: capsule biosynthesis protein [Methylorubrum]MCP1546774.1 capsular polysaccharide transport system permease protein [Methylorubrum zatmanii]MCP1551947.1 capsular polysaccharide transport system permease protein [Methylorubrum extorquens]MCP1577077.1 capsular polysaccharide transport system permease protein [Methylorubrum extorquens]